MRSREEFLAYKRGYNAGRAGYWPKEIANEIPPGAVRELATTAEDLSGKIDALLSGFDDRETDPSIRAIDEAREQIRLSLERIMVEVLK